MRSAKPGNHLNGCNWTFEWNGNQVVLIASPLPIMIERTNKRSTKYGDHNFLSLLCLRQRVESIYLAQLKEYRKILSLFCCSDVLCKLISLSVLSCFCFVLIDHFLGAPLTGSHRGHWKGDFKFLRHDYKLSLSFLLPCLQSFPESSLAAYNVTHLICWKRTYWNQNFASTPVAHDKEIFFICK